MGQHYDHLDISDRACIALRLHDHHSARAIARELGRAPSTITREIKLLRHTPGLTDLPYESGRAQSYAHYRQRVRRRKPKLHVSTPLFSKVCAYLEKGLSPDQIAGRLQREHPNSYHETVSHETIYTALYALPRGEIRRELIGYLRKGHINRRPRSHGTDRKRSGFVSDDVLIHVRPPEVEDRLVPGHWEGDFIKGAKNRSAVGSLVERSSRFVLLAKMDDCSSLSALHGFTALLNQIAPALRKTMTYDRGSEMARHRELTDATSVQVYFADPYSPWQRGSNENANGLIREYLPKGMDLSGITQAELNGIANRLNDRPRRILDYQTPREVFAQLLCAEQERMARNQPLGTS